jgi:hypothetical protein
VAAKRKSVKKRTAVRKRALELLSSPLFFVELFRALCRAGLVGERLSALVVYIVATSRVLAKPLCLFVKGSSVLEKTFWWIPF